MGEFQKRINVEKSFTEKETEVGIACHDRLDKFAKWVEEAKKGFPESNKLREVLDILEFIDDSHGFSKRYAQSMIRELANAIERWFG